jgi:two-component system, cell cycle sensor histidine kinase and response regulator CckA
MSEAILVVEDDPVLRQLFSIVLAEYGYEVSVAASGGEALAVAHGRAGRLDLVVSDVMMPGMSGLELAKRLRSEDESIKILLLSGYGEAALEGLSEPAVAFAEKPLAPAALARKVREVLDGS